MIERLHTEKCWLWRVKRFQGSTYITVEGHTLTRERARELEKLWTQILIDNLRLVAQSDGRG